MRPAESSSLSYGLTARLLLLSTRPRGHAVTFDYRPENVCLEGTYTLLCEYACRRTNAGIPARAQGHGERSRARMPNGPKLRRALGIGRHAHRPFRWACCVSNPRPPWAAGGHGARKRLILGPLYCVPRSMVLELGRRSPARSPRPPAWQPWRCWQPSRKPRRRRGLSRPRNRRSPRSPRSPSWEPWRCWQPWQPSRKPRGRWGESKVAKVANIANQARMALG